MAKRRPRNPARNDDPDYSEQVARLREMLGIMSEVARHDALGAAKLTRDVRLPRQPRTYMLPPPSPSSAEAAS